MKKIISAAAVLLLFVLFTGMLSSCLFPFSTDGNDERIIGTWKVVDPGGLFTANEPVTFLSNGSGSAQGGIYENGNAIVRFGTPFTYSAKNGKLELSVLGMAKIYSYVISGDTLTLRVYGDGGEILDTAVLQRSN